MNRFKARIQCILEEYGCEKEKLKLEIIPKLTGPAKDWFDARVDNITLSFDSLMTELGLIFYAK